MKARLTVRVQIFITIGNKPPSEAWCWYNTNFFMDFLHDAHDVISFEAKRSIQLTVPKTANLWTRTSAFDLGVFQRHEHCVAKTNFQLITCWHVSFYITSNKNKRLHCTSSPPMKRRNNKCLVVYRKRFEEPNPRHPKPSRLRSLETSKLELLSTGKYMCTSSNVTSFDVLSSCIVCLNMNLWYDCLVLVAFDMHSCHSVLLCFLIILIGYMICLQLCFS